MHYLFYIDPATLRPTTLGYKSLAERENVLQAIRNFSQADFKFGTGIEYASIKLWSEPVNFTGNNR